MNRNRIALYVCAVVFIALVIGPGCATKKYVQGEMTTIDKKVENVATEVEASQKRLKEHDEKLASIGEVIAKHDSQFQAVDGKIDDVKKMIRGNLIYKETLRSGDAKFGFDSFELGADAKAALDRFVQQLIEMNRGLYLEIQGHTDNSGPDSVNEALGQKRAEAVMLYLYKQYHIPLYRMQVISLGSSVPVADNTTREGRAQNRRVEILVYE
ncbi:MAG: OmpA family protein [Candidatus Aminicenantales bacterium]|jgi:outer membrane protein OmpA-like peptidoglycan-associated protein